MLKKKFVCLPYDLDFVQQTLDSSYPWSRASASDVRVHEKTLGLIKETVTYEHGVVAALPSRHDKEKQVGH